MDKIKKNRTVLRGLFTKRYALLKEYLDSNKNQEARGCFATLEQYMVKISELDEEILGYMLEDENTNEEDLKNEANTSDEYRSKFDLIKVCVLDIPHNSADQKTLSNSAGAFHSYSLRLPKIEIRKFSGDLKEWLPFWSQFQRIHDDESIPPIDKFYYLDQAVVRSSRAWRVLESFPTTEENYPLVIEALKERFGREDVLIEIYVRDLLSLTLPSNKSCCLAEMYDKLECRLRALEVLGVTKGKCAAILCPLLESCMAEDFLRVWQRSYADRDLPTAENRLEKFMEFMKGEVQNEERINVAMSGFGESSKNLKPFKKGSPKPMRKQSVPTATGLLSLNDKKSTCIFCDDSRHSSSDCYRARDMPLSERIEIVKNKKCCLICTKPYHLAKTCKYKQKCAICDKRHVILLCPSLKRTLNAENVSDPKTSTGVLGHENVLANLTSDSVLLPTMMVKIRGEGVNKVARAVLDTGSQRSYLLNKTAQEMGYQPIAEETVIHSLFGGQKSGICKHNKYKIFLSSVDGTYLCNFDVLSQENICDDVPSLSHGSWTKEMDAIGISQDDRGSIEVLIGADVSAKLLTGNLKQLKGGLTAMETRLGWTLLGKIPHSQPTNKSTAMLITSMLVNDLNISNLWRLDLIGITDSTESKSKLAIQQEVDQFFQDTLTVNSEGRYEVQLPWKDSHPPLLSNYTLALKRLDATLKKLERDGLYAAYDGVFQEWLGDGVIEQVPEAELNQVGHYLPHRPVVKENSTTKVRPVFDASAHEGRSPSLNDCLEKGCNLIEQIPPLLLRFRLKQIGVVADIKRAFLQISISPDDRDSLRFLWKDRKGEIVVYRHRRVVFGLVCSPYQLNAVIRHHLTKVRENCQQEKSCYSSQTIHTLMNSFYVDNTVTSVDDKGQLEILIQEARSLMAEGKFDLRGWESSDPSVSENSKTNVLGLVWNRKEDSLSVNCSAFDVCPEKITKRTILSMAHAVFDPIGFTCPVVLEPKLLLRELWSSKYDWDVEVNDNIKSRFIVWMKKLKYLSDVKVQRWFLNSSEPGKWSVHTFCDASEVAYAAAVFLRVETGQGVSVQLIQAKTRVTPMKNVTIPRLELLAALIGSRLHQSIISSFPDHCSSYFWSDSTTVLAWIRREDQWATFVRNRVAEIRELSRPEQWSHVPGIHNPADLPSRGCSASQLVQSAWWEGPQWLYQPEEHWPSHETTFDEELIAKEKMKSVTCMVNKTNETEHNDWYFRYFSRYGKIVNMLAWIKRFIHNCRSSKDTRQKGPLSVEEIQVAELNILHLIQREVFDDIKSSKITNLQPFRDIDGLIRLKTKISNRPDSHDFRYPVLLPKDHPVVRRLIMDTHTKKGHIGAQGLLNIMREQFWVLGGRKVVRSIISKCMKCKRQDVKKMDISSPPLPIDRVRDAAAFEVTGVDLAGPVFLKNGKKAWICLFTCAVIRAVHLELLTSLSTEEFLQALKRFIARRGRPATIFSDNGTNFVGTENALRRIDWKKVQEYCIIERIKWKFNPPSSPWWGGFFERLVGLLKKILRKVLGRSSLNYTEMETVLCDCESIINSRPLTYVSDDLNELSPITPAMFIQDIREAGVPEIDLIESCNFEKKYKYRVKLREDLRRRFRSEYLGQLKQQAKRSASTSKIQIGDIVMIENDSMKRLDWPLARVTELLPGKDGVVRLVKLKTANGGKLLRPLQRLYPMMEGVEISENNPVNLQLPLLTPTDDRQGKQVTSRGRHVKLPRRFEIGS